MTTTKQKTIERYALIWNKLQASGLPLFKLDKITFNDFKTKTNINSESQFRLAKALARNPERQKQVNQYFNKRNIPTSIVKKTPEKQAIPKVRKVKVKAKPKAKPKVKAKPKPKKVKAKPKPKIEPVGYNLSKIIDDKGNEFWIKSQNKIDFNRQLDIIKRHYRIQSFSIKGYGRKGYEEFITSEFKKELAKIGLT